MMQRRGSDNGLFFLDGVRQRFLSADDVEKKDQPALNITEDIDQFRRLKQNLRARGVFTMAAANLHMDEVIDSQLNGMRNQQKIERNDEVIAGMSLPHLSSPKCPPTRSNGIYRMPRTHRRIGSESDASALLSMVAPCPPSSSVAAKNSTAMKSPETHRKSKSETALMGPTTPVAMVKSSPRDTPSPSRSSSMDGKTRDEVLSQLQASIKQAHTPTRADKENEQWRNNTGDSSSIQNTPTKSNKLQLSPPRKSPNSAKKSSLTFRPTNKFSVTISDRSTKSGRPTFQLYKH